MEPFRLSARPSWSWCHGARAAHDRFPSSVLAARSSEVRFSLMLDCMMSGSRAMRPLIGRSGPNARDTSSPTCRRPEYFIVAAADYDKTGRLPSSPNARWPISGLCTNTRGANGQSLFIGYSGCRPGGLPFDGGMIVRRCAGLARRWPRGRVSTVDSGKKTDARSSYWTTQPAWLRRRYGSLFVQLISEGRSATQATHEMVLLFQGQTIGGRVG